MKKIILAFGIFLSTLTFAKEDIIGMFVARFSTCAWTTKGVRCWGKWEGSGGNAEIQIKVPDDLNGILDFSAGPSHACALTLKRDIRCFGFNTYSYGHTIVPQDIINASQVTAGQNESCAITSQGVRCWGYYGQNEVPNDLGEVYQISIGGAGSVCALTSTGVRCWGGMSQQKVPKDLGEVFQISVGTFHACALTIKGLRCWTGSVDDVELIKVPKDLGEVIEVYAGFTSTCALTDKGVRCWKYGKLETDIPSDLGEVLELGLGQEHKCALTKKGIRCWGSDYYGQSNVPQDLRDK